MRPFRVVLDTNVLVAAMRNPCSASRRILDACLAGQIQPVVSAPVLDEYTWILNRALRHLDVEQLLASLVERARVVPPDPYPHVVPDDPDDAKYLATAVAAWADAIVTNDAHLLVLDPYWNVRILRPTELLGRLGTKI